MRLTVSKFVLALAVTSCPLFGSCKDYGEILHGDATKRDNRCDVFSPRQDISIELFGFTLNPEMGLGLEAEFISTPGKRDEKQVEGEIVLLEDEVQTAAAFLDQHHFSYTALHNHFLFEEPKVLFMHFDKTGDGKHIARELRQLENLIGVFESSGGSSSSSDDTLSATQLNQILDLHGSIKNGVYVADFDRPFKIEDEGVKSEPEGMIAIQGDSENAVIVGEVPVKVKEIDIFIEKLVQNDIQLTALHNHEVGEEPQVYYIHFEQQGPAYDLARRVHRALKTIKIEHYE